MSESTAQFEAEGKPLAVVIDGAAVPPRRTTIHAAGRISQIQPEGSAQLADAEDFQPFWEYRSPFYAGKFLDQWCRGAMRSRIEPIEKIARTLRQHRQLILNWFEPKGTIWAGKSRA